jgi:hypothetical protein
MRQARLPKHLRPVGVKNLGRRLQKLEDQSRWLKLVTMPDGTIAKVPWLIQ